MVLTVVVRFCVVLVVHTVVVVVLIRFCLEETVDRRVQVRLVSENLIQKICMNVRKREEGYMSSHKYWPLGGSEAELITKAVVFPGAGVAFGDGQQERLNSP